MFKRNGKIGRRDLFKTSAGLMGGALLSREAAAEQAPQQNVNTNSSPSALRITDLRVATIVKPGPSPCPIVRIDTNQGVYGLGEVRDGASATYALFLKSRILNENPLNITYIFEKIKQFGFHSRQAGGVVAIEEALWDISGKVYNVPIYQMLGGKFRDRVRIYADTEESDDPHVFAQRLKARKEEMGLTWLKMDVGLPLLRGIPDTVTAPAEQTPWERNQLMHPFVATEITQKGIDRLCEYVQAAREAVGMEIPLSMDHLGHLGVNSIIRLGKAYEKFNLSWMEDVIPWQYTDMLETHKIGDRAMEYGVPMAMHYAGTPVGAIASVHCAAATENFLACENHSLDVPWWQDLVEGIEKPIINKGFIKVSDKPGLGITLNDEVCKQHLRPNTAYFAPTPEWNTERSGDRLWSMIREEEASRRA